MSNGGANPNFESDTRNNEAIEKRVPHGQVEKSPFECGHCDFVDDNFSLSRRQVRNDFPEWRTLQKGGFCVIGLLLSLPHHGAPELTNTCNGVGKEKVAGEEDPIT